MTLSECREAAKRCLPVVHTALVCCHRDNITYSRIKQVGFYYNANGEEKGFVQLLDKYGGSTMDALPEDVVLETDFIKQQNEKKEGESA